MQQYKPKDIEPKWQKIWDETQVYNVDFASDKTKYVAMSMFNYPSGNLHIGHAMNYTISDVKARFKRQQGYESYHPVGWDSFGLPAENRAIKEGLSPQESMAQLIPDYHTAYKTMGWSNDWSKEIATHTPQYYKWTQWVFSQMYKNGLAYQDARMQWWCDSCQTVLANEQVIDGKCWRHDGPDDPEVAKKEIKQWFFKITEYADELLESTDSLDWTESVKLAQKNWIGRSVGAEITFDIDGPKQAITVFTTRPDTLFGATFMVLAPEHELVEHITSSDQQSEVAEYVKQAQAKSDIERQATADKDKTGVFTGSYAINPANNNKVPIWIADYVLAGYGTGAIMAVPAHDERDHAFAQKYNLPIQQVVETVFGQKQGDEVEKDAIIAIVKNPSNGKVLVLDWGERKQNWGGKLFIGGGLHANESLEECALREIQEETGFKNVKHVKTGEFSFINFHYSQVKDKHYKTRITPLLFELENEEKVATNLDDNEDQFTIVWVDEFKLAETIEDPAHFYGYEQLHASSSIAGEGDLINSGDYSGISASEAREKIVADLAKAGKAQEKVNYKMRDWSVSRQRYWGAPIPIINCGSCGPVLIEDDNLPVVLPELKDFQPSGDGRSALARATEWLKVDCPKCKGQAERETDTLDTYICSSWYMYRYLDPFNEEEIFNSNQVKKWEPIDFYNGGDHATAHLLYARFIGHFFKNLGLVENPEPFKQFVFNGKVTASDGTMFSKSKGNGVDPLAIIGQGYGADALRTYLMFAAPLEYWAKWDEQGVPGAYRFLSRIWVLVQEYLAAEPTKLNDDQAKQLLRPVHVMVKKMTEDIQENRYNTAIAASMECVNALYKAKNAMLGKCDEWQKALEYVVACIAPFAPHVADELWYQLGKSSSIQKDSWPQWDNELLAEDTMTLAVQVNGKVRSQITIAKDASKEVVLLAAKEDEKIKSFIGDQSIKKEIYVPGRIINIVV